MQQSISQKLPSILWSKLSETKARGLPQFEEEHLPENKNPTATIIRNGMYNTFSLRLQQRQKCLLSPLQFNILMEVLANAVRQEKQIKDIEIGEIIKWSAITDSIIVIIENPKNIFLKILELVNESSKLTR